MPLGRDFLSSNQYSCIVLNAESLLLFYHWLCSDPELRAKVPASAFGFGSQRARTSSAGSAASTTTPTSCWRRCSAGWWCARRWSSSSKSTRTSSSSPRTTSTRATTTSAAPPSGCPPRTARPARAILAEALNVAKQRLAALGMQLKGATPTPRMAEHVSSVRAERDNSARQADFNDVDDVEEAPSDGELELPPPPRRSGSAESDSEEEDTEDEEEIEEEIEVDGEDTTNLGVDGLPAALTQLGLHFGELAAQLPARKTRVRDLISQETFTFNSAAAKCSDHAKQSSDRLVRVRLAKGKRPKQAE